MMAENIVSQWQPDASIKVGDAVAYFPHQLYAKEQSGNPRSPKFPWAFGWNMVVQDPENPRQSRVEVQELSHKQLQAKLDWLARHSDPSMERKRLVPLKPLEAWQARVTEVNPDGTVDLAVVSGTRSGVLLNMRGVRAVPVEQVRQLCSAPRDEAGGHPAAVLAHTCHVPEGAN
jgi:hypothetical protein